MLKTSLAASIAAAALLSAQPAFAQSPDEMTWTRAGDTRRIDFPITAKGERVLAVDTHTHTVFSDGVVWPAVRVWEAEQDHLAAYAVTDHLDYQRYKADVRTGDDHNRAYEIAAEEAKRIGAKVLPIRGTEITRNAPWGHFNALFLKDANALPVDATMNLDPRPALRAAREQGAFVIWNHPWALPGLDAVADPMPAAQRGLVADHLVDAVEIANSSQYSAVAFDMALKHDLAVVGASDVHGPIDVDWQIPEGQHRTATLVIARDGSGAAIQEAMAHSRTAALYRQTLYGRRRELDEIVGGALRVVGRKRIESFLTKDVVELELRNDAFMPFQLRFAADSPLTSPRVVTIPASGKLVILFANVTDMEAFAPKVEVLNAFVDPRTNLILSLR
ncbi:Sb-PDE family phosphodiesterase [Caulobacter sp. RL271]|uniref:Sb-PDE family phosphodiesterase n=1 Tax=Caulobacter segnis TaxID=88688 RepID=A0ABY4ZYD1_9CAUL|nr:Sb-PDE family phosphodiesterase [Caulobacter segnis]USQ97558.1 Sb-PDE family phosphodiesterase [Caulobacter segnis]